MPLKAGFNPQVGTGHAGTHYYKSFVHRQWVRGLRENITNMTSASRAAVA
jgi:hypothetical protein